MSLRSETQTENPPPIAESTPVRDQAVASKNSVPKISLDKFRHLHWWMLGLFLISQTAIFNYYWPTFSSEKWKIHIHFWTVGLWYIFLIVQPYLIARGEMNRHRTLGIIGFMIAGGAIISGISLMEFALELAMNRQPGQPGPPPSRFYSILISEFVDILAFTFAIIMGVVHRKDLQNHSWWLIASAFYMIMPSIGRGLIRFWLAVLPPENFSPLFPMISSELVYGALLTLFAWRFGKLKHPATGIGFLLILLRIVANPIGAMEGVQEFIKQVIVL